MQLLMNVTKLIGNVIKLIQNVMQLLTNVIELPLNMMQLYAESARIPIVSNVLTLQRNGQPPWPIRLGDGC